MSLQFLGIERGLELDDVQWIVVDADPDTGVGDSDTVGMGSFATNKTESSWWKKIANGVGADKWRRIVDTKELAEAIAAESWRKPVWTIDTTNTVFADAVTELNTSNMLGGATLSNEQRVLLATVLDGGGNNVYTVERERATLDFGTAATDQIRVEAKTRGSDGNAISIVYTTNGYDDATETTAVLTHTDAVAASCEIGVGATDKVAVTADVPGTGGNAYDILYTTNTFDGAAVTTADIAGSTITVSLANDGGSSITATVNDVIAAINDAGNPVSSVVTAAFGTGAVGVTVIGAEYGSEPLIDGVDLDEQITISLENTHDDVTLVDTIVATTDDVKAAIDNDVECTALVSVEVLDSAVVSAEHVEANLAGGTGGSAVVSSAQIGVATVDQVNVTGNDTDNTRSILYTTNGFDAATVTTVGEAAGVFTVNLANERIASILATGTPNTDEIDYVAVLPGVQGNNITIELTHNTWDGAVATTAAAVGDVITVNLANDGGSTITSTVQQVVNAINTTGSTSALVSASIGVGTTGTTAIAGAAAPANMLAGESNITATAQDVVDALTDDATASAAFVASLGYSVVGTTVISAEHGSQSIDGGSSGDWILVEDPDNEETNGDILWVDQGDNGGRVYRREEEVWIQQGRFERTELIYIRNFIGKEAYGNELPDYSSENWIDDGDNLVVAISKLDAEIGPNVTGGVYISTNYDVNQNIQNLNDAIENIKYISKTEGVQSSTIISGTPTISCMGLKFFVFARNMSGVNAHLNIGTNSNDEVYVVAERPGSDFNTISVVYTVNGYNGATSTTAVVTGTLDGVNPVVITVNLANDGASAITATCQDAVDALNTGDSATLVDASVAAGSTAGNTIGAAYTVQNMLEGLDYNEQVNAAEIFVSHDRPDDHTDATVSDHTTYAKLKTNGEIPGLSFSTSLTGTGATQDVNLVAESNVVCDITVYRMLVDAI